MDFEDYIKQLEANGFSIHTIKIYRQVYGKLTVKKSFNTLTKDDLVDFFKNFQGTIETKRLYQTKVKKLFRDIGKADLVEWIQLVKQKETLRADDILTVDDVNRLLDATEGIYWKAYIAFLFESGCRSAEAQKLTFKDFKETNEGIIVDIPTDKTSAGFRRVLLVASGEYIRLLKAYTSLPADNAIFYMSESYAYQKLKEIAERAGITKPMSPHKFRHAQATLMVHQEFQESIIRKKLGWTPTSTMISRYQHLNDNAVVEATLRKDGKMPGKIVITHLKAAEGLTPVDAATKMQLSKLSEEINKLKERNKEYENMYGDIEQTKNTMHEILEAVKSGKIVINRSKSESKVAAIEIGHRKD